MIINKIKKANQGAVALILVIMITALTVVSAAVVSMTNISNLMSSYFFGEAEGVDVELDACLEDAMFRLASSTSASGTYYLSGVGINCYYEIASSITDGFKTVTSTASSTTSNIGYWQDTVVVQVNVSSTPITIDSYKNSNISYSSFEYCGDGSCNASETCSDCVADCGGCEVCGNGIQEGSEACDDNNVFTEGCGNGVQEIGTFCNSNCTVEVVLNEACDSALSGTCAIPSGYYAGSYTHAASICQDSKVTGVACNATCTACSATCL